MPLDYADVKERVTSANENVLEELYSFGQSLVKDAVERLSRADGKAASLAAFCGGVITVVVSTSPLWIQSHGRVFAFCTTAGVIAIFIGALVSVSSIYPQATEWYADDDWLKMECFKSPTAMLRYRLLCMWRVISSHHALYKRKTARIKKASIIVGIGFLALFLALVSVAWGNPAFHDLHCWVRNFL